MGKRVEVAPNSGLMLAIVARSARARLARPSPANSTNEPTTPKRRSISVTTSTRSVAVEPRGQLPGEAHADDPGHRLVERLAEEDRLGLDPADAVAEHAEPVDHRRVRVGPDERVGEGHAVAGRHDRGQVLEVDLVDDARARAARPAGRGTRSGPSAGAGSARCCGRTRATTLNRNAAGVPYWSTWTEWSMTRSAGTSGLTRAGSPPRSAIASRMTARSTTAGTPGEVLEDDPGRHERDLGLGRLARPPRGERRDVGLADDPAAGVPEHVLEEDLEGHRDAPEVEPGRHAAVGQGGQRVAGPAAPPRGSSGRRTDRSRPTHRPLAVATLVSWKSTARTVRTAPAAAPGTSRGPLRPPSDRPCDVPGEGSGEGLGPRGPERTARRRARGPGRRGHRARPADAGAIAPRARAGAGEPATPDGTSAARARRRPSARPPPCPQPARRATDRRHRRAPGAVGHRARRRPEPGRLADPGRGQPRRRPARAVPVARARRPRASPRPTPSSTRSSSSSSPSRTTRSRRSPAGSTCTAARRSSTRAGSSAPTALSPAMAAGTQIGAFHPLVAFADTERAVAALHGATIAIEGDDQLLDLLARMAEAIGGVPVRLAPGRQGRLPRRGDAGGRRPRRAARRDRRAGPGRRPRRGGRRSPSTAR